MISVHFTVRVPSKSVKEVVNNLTIQALATHTQASAAYRDPPKPGKVAIHMVVVGKCEFDVERVRSRISNQACLLN